MAVPTEAEIRRMMERHVELWNANDKARWLEEWQAIAPGEPTMEDPVGTPARRGWEAVAEAWDATPPSEWRITMEKLIVCANEAAAVMRNEGVVNGAPVAVESIEVYAFADDGSLSSRTYWTVPPS